MGNRNLSKQREREKEEEIIGKGSMQKTENTLKRKEKNPQKDTAETQKDTNLKGNIWSIKRAESFLKKKIYKSQNTNKQKRRFGKLQEICQAVKRNGKLERKV